MSVFDDFRIFLGSIFAGSGGSAGTSPSAGASVVRLTRFTLQSQQEDQWCWAATAVSVTNFFGSTAPATPWAQCDLVNHRLGQTTCCRNSSSSQCNRSSSTGLALGVTSNFNRLGTPAASVHDILSELSAGNPVVARIDWTGGGAHVVVISGCQNGVANPTLDIDDPDGNWGSGLVPYNTLTSSYQGSGQWTHSYFTQP